MSDNQKPNDYPRTLSELLERMSMGKKPEQPRERVPEDTIPEDLDTE